jgi:hypothetical protein
MAVNTYNLDRKTVSRMLACSLRTVDRYVSSGKIGFVKNSGRTWLSAEDVRALMSATPSQEDTYNEYVSWRETPKTNQATRGPKMSQDSDFAHETEYIPPHSHQSDTSLSYKQLYLETKTELEEKEGAIENLKIQLAKIEASLKQMVPLFELQKQRKLLSQNNQRYADHIRKLEEIYKKKASNLKHEISIKEHEIEVERFNKSIFAVVLFLVLLLQPVFWFLMN